MDVFLTSRTEAGPNWDGATKALKASWRLSLALLDVSSIFFFFDFFPLFFSFFPFCLRASKGRLGRTNWTFGVQGFGRCPVKTNWKSDAAMPNPFVTSAETQIGNLDQTSVTFLRISLFQSTVYTTNPAAIQSSRTKRAHFEPS